MASVLMNQRKNATADHIYADVKGQMTDENHPDIFGPELLPGETIIREFREFSLVHPRPTWLICVLGCLTWGVYCCYIYLCGCIRIFSIGNHRTRLALTDKGRLMTWMSNLNGTRNFLTHSYTSRTELQWFHCSTMTSYQMYLWRLNRCGPFTYCGYDDHARVRIYFGDSYPSTTALSQMGAQDSGALQGLRRPEWNRAKELTGNLGEGTEEDESLGPFAFVMHVMENLYLTAYHRLTCGKNYQPARDIPLLGGGRGDFVLDLDTTVNDQVTDGYHNEPGESWDEFVDFIKCLTQAKGVDTLSAAEPNESSFLLASSEDMDEARQLDLISGDRVAYDKRKFPTLDDEEVLDGLKIKPRLTWWEFFCATPGVLSSPKYKATSAVVLTTHKAVTASEYKKGSNAAQYELILTTYFFGKLGGGMVITDPKGSLGYSIDVTTTYGALRLAPIMSDTWPWSSKIPPKHEKRMKSFMDNLERACHTKQCIPAPAKGSLPNDDDVNDVYENINLWEDEELCSVVRSANLYNLEPYMGILPLRILACGDRISTKEFVKFLSCGCRPWKLDEFLVLTTHRLIAFQRVTNDARFSMFEGKNSILIWVPLTDVSGMKMVGSFEAAGEGCWQKVFQQCCRCCNTNTASLEVKMGLEASYKTAPLSIGRLAAHANTGLLEGRADLRHFRAAFAYYMSQKEVQKGDFLEPHVTNENYGHTPWPEGLEEPEEGAQMNPMGEKGESPQIITVGTQGG